MGSITSPTCAALLIPFLSDHPNDALRRAQSLMLLLMYIFPAPFSFLSPNFKLIRTPLVKHSEPDAVIRLAVSYCYMLTVGYRTAMCCLWYTESVGFDVEYIYGFVMLGGL